MRDYRLPYRYEYSTRKFMQYTRGSVDGTEAVHWISFDEVFSFVTHAGKKNDRIDG